MKELKVTLRAWILSAALLITGPAVADTIVGVTDVTYDAALRPICTAVRMNPANFGAGVSNACALQTAGTYGPDRITYNVLDAAGQVTEVDQAYGVTTANGFPPTQAVQRAYARYSYNPNGTILYQVDADNNTTQYAYDGFDRLQTIYYPCPSTQYCANGNDYEQFQYDSNGNKMVWRRRNGKTLYYNYDALNREILHYVSDGSVPNVYSDYDLMGHPCIVAYSTDVHTAGPNCTSLFVSLGTTQGLHYKYNAFGWLAATTDMNGRTVSYAYNQAGVRTLLWFPEGQSVGYAVDAANRMTGFGFGAYSGLLTQTYDNLGRIVNQGKLGGSTSYTHDNLGRLTGMANDLAGTAYDIGWSFTYNPAGQIASSSANNTVYDYQETTNSTVNQAYDGLNRDAGVAALSGGYDAQGNLTGEGTGGRTFTYDVENRLLTGTGPLGSVVLVYDPEGRIARYSKDGGVTYLTLLYDGVNIIGFYDASGTVISRYIHGTGTDNPPYWLIGSGTADVRPLYTDYHGSVVGETDASGNLTTLYKYGPYGEPKDINNADYWLGSNFRYTGQFAIPILEVYDDKARIYDPKYGHFLQTDPIGSKDDLDLYTYTGDDPVDHSDPTGDQAAAAVPAAAVGCAGDAATGCVPGAVVAGGVMFCASSSWCRQGAVDLARAAVHAIGRFAANEIRAEASGESEDDTIAQARSSELAKYNRAFAKAEALASVPAKSGDPEEFQYALRAEAPGNYPDLNTGGTIHLNEGDVWKYGTTANPTDRYSLGKIKGFVMDVETTGTATQVLAQEKIQILGYVNENGRRPPGNPIYR